MVAETPDPAPEPPEGGPGVVSAAESPSEPPVEVRGVAPRTGAASGGAVWHYARSGSATVGPIATAALREAAVAGAIAPDTAVWRPEFGAEWRAAASIPDLIPARRERERRRQYEREFKDVRRPMDQDHFKVTPWSGKHYAPRSEQLHESSREPDSSIYKF